MGEAQHPGPHGKLARALSINVSSAEYRLDSLTDQLGEAGLCLLQDARLRPARRHLGGHLLMGPAVTWDGKCLVAAVGVGGAFRDIAVVCPGGLRGRVQHVVAFFGGATALHVAHVYAPPQSVAACCALVSVASALVASLGQVPALIFGDFNQDPLPERAEWDLYRAGVTDIARHLGPTCLANRESPTTIDRAFANSAARAMLVQCRVHGEMGFLPHMAIELAMAVGPPPLYRAPPARRPLAGRGAADSEDAGAPARARAVLESFLPAAVHTVRTGGLDAGWRSLCRLAQRCLEARAGIAGSRASRDQLPQPEVRAAFLPRRRVGVDGLGLRRHAAELTLQARRLATLQGLWPYGAGAVPHRAELVLRVLRQDAAGPWRALLRDIRRDDLEELVARARREAGHASRQDQAGRRAAWHDFCARDVARGGRHVHRWVRNGPRDSFAPVVPAPTEPGADPGWVAGPGAVAHLSDLAWHKLWVRPDDPHPEESEWLSELDDLPPFPPLSPFTRGGSARLSLSSPWAGAGVGRLDRGGA